MTGRQGHELVRVSLGGAKYNGVRLVAETFAGGAETDAVDSRLGQQINESGCKIGFPDEVRVKVDDHLRNSRSSHAGRSFHDTTRRSRNDFSASRETLMASLPT